MEWNTVEQLIGKISVAATAVFGAWKAYQKFLRPIFFWCKNQLGLLKRVISVENQLFFFDEKLDLIIKLSPFPIFSADYPTGAITEINSAWAEFFDLNFEEANSWQKKIKEQEKIKLAWEELLSKNIPINDTFTYIISNIKINIRAYIHRNKHGYPQKIMGKIIKL